jgi:hypothetical protein
VRPSSAPPKPDEAEQRRKATLEGTHLKGPPLQKKKSLAGVSDEWAHQQCRLAQTKTEELGTLLKKQDTNPKAVTRVLGQLRDIFDRMASPPPPKEKTGPAKQAPKNADAGPGGAGPI